VAHRALASREDHHRLLRRQPRHPLRHRRHALSSWFLCNIKAESNFAY
jgi:hypothetical protein